MTEKKPTLCVVAGPNGSGKTILGFYYVEDNLIRFRNPEIATSLLESLQNNEGLSR